MKKILFATLVALLVLAGCSKSTTEELRVYNWGEYIDKSLIKEFEKENNVKVIYELFNSNELMYNKLQDGSKYDVIIPSDYMTERMREEGLLQKIDFAKVPNAEKVIPTLKNRHMDPTGEYTVPYFWGNVGIVYNKNTVDLSDLETQGWEILQNEKYKGKLFFYDSERDAFMIALKSLGFSMNSNNPEELEQAYNWLVEMRKNMDPVYATDDAIDNMVNGIKDIAIMYSGDANYIISQNEEMAYYVPKEGTNQWVDAMVIPVNAENPDMAHKWINFMLDDASSLAITEEVGYTSPIQSVIDEVTGAGGAYEGIESYVPRVGYEKDEEFFHDMALKVIMNDYWQKILATR